MKVALLTKDRPASLRAFDVIRQEKGEIVGLVISSEPGPLAARAADALVPLVDAGELLERCDETGPPDLVVSFLYGRKIDPAVIRLPTCACINLHPAPLPDFRGLGGYHMAILEGLDTWGASVHYVDEERDAGDLIDVVRFPIDADGETAWSLGRKTVPHLLDMLRRCLQLARKDGYLPGESQGEGRFVSRKEFLAHRRITPDDSAETIDRKIRAFWHPPHGGAQLELDGRLYTLANERVLREAGEIYGG